MSTSAIVRRFREAEIPIRAAALAYHSLLGFVPLMILILSYLRAIGVTKAWRDLVNGFVLSHLDVATGKEVTTLLGRTTTMGAGRTMPFIGIVVLAYTIYSLVTKLGNSLDLIFHTAIERPSMNPRFIKLWLRRVLVMTVLPVVLLCSAVFMSWLQKDSYLRVLFDMQTVGSYLVLPVPILADILAIFLIYRFIPKYPGSWRRSLMAAAFVGPAFSIARQLMSFYNRWALANFQVSGAIAAFLVLLVWVHIAWMIVLSGALLVTKAPVARRFP